MNISKVIKSKYEIYKLKTQFKKQERKYKKLIKSSLKNGDIEDVDLLSDRQFNEQKELDERNHLYSTLLQSYVNEYTKNQNKKNRKKWQFYYVITISFIVFLLFLVAMTIIVIIFFNKERNTVLITYLTSFLGIFSTLAIMPHTIVKYLFNPKEDEIISKVVTDMQSHDNRTKEIIISAENNTNEKNTQKKRRKQNKSNGRTT